MKPTRLHVIVVLALGGLSVAFGAQPPVPPPVPSSPAHVFRRMLAMEPAAREALLASYPEQKRAFVRSKVEEYLALSPQDREARLKALELRAQMLPLMRMNAPARAEQIQSLDPDRRREIEDRLRTWDILPPPLRQDVLQHETTIRFFLELKNTGASRETILSGQSPEQRVQLERDYAAWESLSAERREQMVANYDRFFGAEAGARSRSLAGLPEADRARLEATLQKLNQLPAEQRKAVLDGYERYRQLSPVEQAEFRRNAERWQAMSESEREVWRRLVIHVRIPSNVMPPMPPRTSQAIPPSPLAATNPGG